MSAPSKVHVGQLVKIQSDKGLTSTSEQNRTPGKATCRREAKGKGYRATTQVNVLSPEITIVSDADTVHKGGRQNSQIRCGEELRDRRGLRQLHGIKWATWELGRPDVFLRKVCYDKSGNDEELQMIHRESDKSIVAMKQSNVCGAKGLTGNRGTEETSSRFKTGKRKVTESESVTCLVRGKEVLLKSWMRENCTSSSVRGFVVSSNYWRWL